jgi:4-hydroxy-tetrahydrodipicolinate synthase
MTELRGIVPYLVTPFDADSGRLRERELQALVGRLIESGVHGLSPLGTTGEFAFLTGTQRDRVVELVVRAAAGAVPVVPAVAGHATHDAVEQSLRFQDLGAAGLVAIRQQLFPIPVEQAAGFFAAVGSAVDIPVVVYTNPVLGSDVGPSALAILADVPNIRYIKDASGVTGRSLSLLLRFGDRFGVFSSSADLPVTVMQLGGVGWMSGPACAVPRAAVALYEHCTAGRWDEAFELQRALWPVNELFQRYSLAGCVKLALTLRGLDVGAPIPPQPPLPTGAGDELRAALAGADAVIEETPWVA